MQLSPGGDARERGRMAPVPRDRCTHQPGAQSTTFAAEEHTMNVTHAKTTDRVVAAITQSYAAKDFAAMSAELEPMLAPDLIPVVERLNAKQRAAVYRLLQKDRAAEVFELLDPALQSDLLGSLEDAEVAKLFVDLDHNDRLWLLDEVPAALAARLLRGLPEQERAVTSALLGYPEGSVGRRMSLAYVAALNHQTVAEALDQVRERLADAETVYVVPVVDDFRLVVGVVELRALLGADPGSPVADLMTPVHTAAAIEDAEHAARRCADRALLAMPIVDREQRLVGILALEDALRILEHEESEDAARQGGTEPLRRPYLSTPVRALVRSRVVWLLVLAVGATLTVQVLSVFEATIEQVTVLALFVPLLIGTGGNTGNQAATTVTRALALGDVTSRDFLRVLARELRTGALLGLLLGALGFAITGFAFSFDIGLVIGLTLLCVCTVAAAVGGCMPLLARAVNVDPAVFSNPFISTFVDALGLIIYFAIATTVLGL